MLAIKNLRKPLDNFLIEISSLTVETGSIFLLLGPTGSGKSKLLEILAGFESCDTGQVQVGLRDVTELPPERRGIAIIFQEPQLFPHLNVARNIAYASQNKALFQRIVELLGLTPHLSKPVSVISGGERQLVAIARALMIKPEILLLDEAFSAIDPDQRRRVLRSFLAVQREFQITTLAVTHNFDEALYLGSQIGVLMQGKLIQVGRPQDVFQNPSAPPVARFLGAENLFYGQFEKSDPSIQGEVPAVSLLSATFRSESGVILRVLAENEGPGYVLVHPKDITLSAQKPQASSALNQLEGVIRRIVDKGVLVQVHIDAGMPFEVSITPQSRKGLGLEEGSNIYLSFKAAAVKTY